MLLVFVAIAAFGHALLWVALVNRLHGTALGRTWMDVLTGACGIAVVGIPLAIAAILFSNWQTPPVLQIIAWAYLAAAALLAAAGGAHRIWVALQPERLGSLHANHTTKIRLRDRSTEPLAARSTAWICHLPGNQVFDVRLHEKQISIPRLPAELAGLRIAHLSDLHMSGRVEKAYFREVAEAVNDTRPDLVAITGDLVERNACIDWIPETLGRLRADSGVYFVLGNHDLRVDQLRLLTALADAGLTHVGGRVVALDVRHAPLQLAGNELPWYGPAPDVNFRTSNPLPIFNILLSHSPDQFAWAINRGFDLMLAGHNHGGQVRLPILGPLLAPSLYGVRYASGVFRRGDTVLHVSRGTASFTPLRYNCPPEIAVLELIADR
jgi:predicted MPP superfamily phosphohydrolase